MQKLIIEVAQNEDNVTKAENPHVPITPEEIAADAIACARAGASIVHFHCKDPETGENRLNDPELYMRTVRLIRKESNAIVCPSYSARFIDTSSVRDALSHWEEFARDPDLRPEVTGVVPRQEGNYGVHYDPETRSFDHRKKYITEFLEFLRDYDIKPIVWVSEIGHFREMLSYLDCGLIDEPLAIKIYMSDVGLYGINPARAEEYSRLCEYLKTGHDWQVMTAVYGRPGTPSKTIINSLAISMGHHVRTGIGDLNRTGFGLNHKVTGPDSRKTNPQMIAELVATAQAMGRDIATPDEARALLGIRRR